MREHIELPKRTVGPTIARTLLAMARTRFDLLHADLAEEQDSLVAQVRLSVIAGAAGLLAGFTAILTIAAAVPAEYRAGTLGLLALLLAGLSFWAFRLRAQHRPRFSRPFARLLEQLHRDSEAAFGRSRETPSETP